MEKIRNLSSRSQRLIYVKTKPNGKDPVWFNDNIEKEEITAEESQELEELLKEFR